MVIKKLEIHGFGKLSSLKLDLKDGMNVIFGRNEAGKSSLQWFIKSMLFGLRGGKALKDEVLTPLKRFKPWMGESYGGSVEYLLDDGDCYRVERDFSKNTVHVYDSVFRDITGLFPAERETGSRFAEKHLGMNAACFERTVFIGQTASVLDVSGGKELMSRLTNLGQTGSEEVSLRLAEKALKEALKNYVGTGRTSVRPMDRVQERMRELSDQQDLLMKKRQALAAADQELNRCKRIKAGLERKKSALASIKELLSIRNRMETLKRQEILLEDMARQISVIKEQLAKTQAELERIRAQKALLIQALGEDNGKQVKIKAKRAYLFGVVFAAAALCLAALMLVAKPGGETSAYSFIPAGAPALGAVFVFLAGNRLRKGVLLNEAKQKELSGLACAGEEKMHEILDLSDRIRDRLGRCSFACGVQMKDIKDVTEALVKAGAEHETAIDSFDKIRMEIFPMEDPGKMDTEVAHLYEEYCLEDGIPASELLRLEALWEKDFLQTCNELDEIMLKIREYETLIKAQAAETEELQVINEELGALELRKKQLEDTNFSLETALHVLEEAGDELQRDFVPALNRKLNEIICTMTGGRYQELKADSDLALRVLAPETDMVADALLLSGGTVDQAYFALRLSAAELLEKGGNRLPLILDEVFAQYDDSRSLQAFRFLKERYPGRQVLFLTCKGREMEMAREVYGENMNLVCL